LHFSYYVTETNLGYRKQDGLECVAGGRTASYNTPFTKLANMKVV
jgi:hypothetical protein